MAEMNLYLIKFDEVERSSNGKTFSAPDSKTVVANGDALKAVEKLRKNLIGTSWKDDEDDEGKKLKKPITWKTIDVKIHHIERIAGIDFP